MVLISCSGNIICLSAERVGNVLHRWIWWEFVYQRVACDSVNTEVSHVIKAIGVPSEYSEGTIRISFGRDNTEEDAIMIAKALVKVIKG